MSRDNSNGFFRRALRETCTAAWINSAVQSEIETALKWGAMGNTWNPAHPPKAIKTDRALWQPVIDEILQQDHSLSDDDAVDLFIQRIAERSSKLFLPLYEESMGKFGYVSIQSNPNTNDDYSTLMRQAITYSQLAGNVVPKIPSTKVGAQVIEDLTATGINTIATMGFSIDQVIAMAEAYENGLSRMEPSRPKPKCFVVIIPGIFDDYLTEQVNNQGISIAPGSIRYAGVAVSRAAYKLFRERGYQASLQVGGTRQTYHITDLIGDAVHITHSFDTWARLVEENPPVVSKISDEIPARVLSELEDRSVDFRKAYRVGSLLPDEFRDFGPCAMFNNICKKGFSDTLVEIQARRDTVQAKAMSL